MVKDPEKDIQKKSFGTQFFSIINPLDSLSKSSKVTI